MKYLFAILGLLLGLVVASKAKATTFFVDKGHGSASDSNACTSAALPCLTINGAFGKVTTTSGAGADDIVEVSAGTYAEQVPASFILPSGTSWAHPFTLRAKTNDSVIIQSTTGNNIATGAGDATSYFAIIDGFIVDGTNISSSSISTDAGHIRFLNLEIRNNPHTAVQTGPVCHNLEFIGGSIHDGAFIDVPNPASGGEHGYPLYLECVNSLVDGVHIYNFPSYGIHNYRQSGDPSGNVIRNNRIHNGSVEAFNCCGRSPAAILVTGTGTQVYNNVIYSGFIGIAAAVSGGGGCTGCNIINNTVYNMANAGYERAGGASGVLFRNNLASSCGSNGCFYTPDATSATFSNNGCDVSTSGCATGLTEAASATFDDKDNAIFTLKSASKMHTVGGGDELQSVLSVTTAINGTTRISPYDVGAYEFTGTASTCSATPIQMFKFGFNGVGTDSSGNGNNISALGSGNAYNASGKYGSAILFGGTAAASVDASSTLYPCTAHTIMAWIKPTTSPTDFTSVIAKRETSTGQGYWMYSAAHPSYCTNSGPIGGYTQGGVNAYDCYGTAFSSGTWYHYAEVYDSTFPTNSIKKYINGVLVTSADGNAVLDDNADDLLFGGSVFGEFFTGYIDEAKGWNYALTNAEIIVEMNTPVDSLISSTFLTVGASSTILKFGANSAVLKLQGAQ